jgi:membrane protein YdbS with pleckstrin-like domain
MIRALLHSADHLFNSDGAWWILALDSILLIPLIFAVFFYPMAVLLGVAAAAVLTVGLLVCLRAVHSYRHRHP